MKPLLVAFSLTATAPAPGLRQAVHASLEGLELVTPPGAAPAARRAVPLPQLRKAVHSAR
jgi:hypothetical protein